MTEPTTLPTDGPARRRPPAVARDALCDTVRAQLTDRGGVLLTGPAGIGRTTVVTELVTEASARGHRVLRCSPSPAERHSPYLGLIDLLSPLDDDALGGLATHERTVLEAA
ncbi:AAA family ATPase, partial [Streptomyces sp. Tu 6176]|uniref:AAA family ATPase n=1 Tax=Streptomyces sp. Tu 6176 TaxID=1470557 RepID=UPI00056D5294